MFLKIFSRKMCKVKKFKVFVTRPDLPEAGINMLREECSLTIWKTPVPIPRRDFLKSIKGMDGLLVTVKEKIDGEVLSAAGPQLKVVATASVGHDHIDLAECKKNGVRVGHTPEVLTDATAELTVALLLCTSRRLPQGLAAVKDGSWKNWSLIWLLGPGLANSTVGIVGFGRIGQAVARRVKPFNVSRILYTNRTERPEAKDVGAVKVSFDELLKESDFVICCTALTRSLRQVKS